MKLADAQARVLEAALNEFGADIDRDVVVATVRLAIEAIGFHLALDGEICDPRPRPTQMPGQQGARWGGGTRRRRS